jgi:hypothetical protein
MSLSRALNPRVPLLADTHTHPNDSSAHDADFVTLEECGFASSTPGWKEDFVTRGVQITFWLDEDSEEEVETISKRALEWARREAEFNGDSPASIEAVMVSRL